MKKSNIEIRALELEDLATVYALGESLFTAELYPNLYRTWDEYELVEFFAADEDTCFVAEADGVVIGFLLGTLIDKRRSAWRYGWVVWLGVHPGFAGRGIGKRLLARASDKFIELGARMLMADTAADNDHAIRFFEGAGFGNHEKHVYLTKNLKNDPKYVARATGPRRRKKSSSKR